MESELMFVKHHAEGRGQLSANLPKRHVPGVLLGWQMLLSPLGRVFHTYVASHGRRRGTPDEYVEDTLDNKTPSLDTASWGTQNTQNLSG